MMGRSIFGWDYPPGAEHDPNAPYNQVDAVCEVCGADVYVCECPECPVCTEVGNPACAINGGRGCPSNVHTTTLALMDELGCYSLYGVYRRIYKGTDCGPSVGFLVEYTIEQDNGEGGPHGVADEYVSRWIYCDDLLEPLKGTPYTLKRECLSSVEPMVVIRGIRVGSIVEGTDRECQTITINSPCSPQNVWDAVEAVNEEAEEIWMNTHGCEHCWPDGRFDDYGNEQEFGDWPVNLECQHCKGRGVVV